MDTFLISLSTGKTRSWGTAQLPTQTRDIPVVLQCPLFPVTRLNPFQNPGSAASHLGIHMGLFPWFDFLHFRKTIWNFTFPVMTIWKIQSQYSRDANIQLRVRSHSPHKLKTWFWKPIMDMRLWVLLKTKLTSNKNQNRIGRTFYFCQTLNVKYI